MPTQTHPLTREEAIALAVKYLRFTKTHGVMADIAERAGLSRQRLYVLAYARMGKKKGAAPTGNAQSSTGTVGDELSDCTPQAEGKGKQGDIHDAI